jgi:hypothetical protein
MTVLIEPEAPAAVVDDSLSGKLAGAALADSVAMSLRGVELP